MELEGLISNLGGFGSIRLDSDMRPLEDTGGMFEALGLKGAAKPLNLDVLLDSADTARLKTLIEEADRQKSPSHGTFHTREGRRHFELIVTATGDGTYTALYRPLEEIRQAVERLEVFYKNFRNTRLGVCFTDERGDIIDANESFLRLYGYKLSEVKGKNPRVLKSGRQSSSVYKKMWAAISDPSKGTWSGELINRRKDGAEVFVNLTISSVRRPDGSLIGYVASTLDLTERRRLELGLKSKNDELDNLNRLKSELMAITSHDLKAPLNAIFGYADLAAEGLKDGWSTEKLSGYMEKIRLQCGRMTDFINDLLDLRKVEAGKFGISPRRVKPLTVLQACVELNLAGARIKGIDIELRAEGQNLPAALDPLKLEQVFNNLISNAVKFSPEQSSIVVRYTDDGGPIIRVTVSDQGPGIPQEEVGAIFDPYYQVKKQGALGRRAFGSGLGLSVVKSIVELHGGHIGVQNLPGGGCEFTVEFPRKKAADTPAALAAILIDPAVGELEHIGQLLKSREVDVYTVRSVEEESKVLLSELPDLSFISDQAAESVFADPLLKHTKQGHAIRTIVIKTKCGDSSTSCAAGVDELVQPVVDMEINELLSETLLDIRKRG